MTKYPKIISTNGLCSLQYRFVFFFFFLQRKCCIGTEKTYLSKFVFNALGLTARRCGAGLVGVLLHLLIESSVGLTSAPCNKKI